MQDLYHPIQTGPIGSTFPPFLQTGKWSSIQILTDQNTHQHCLPTLQKEIPTLADIQPIIIPAGEQHKNITTLESIWQSLMQTHADRNTLLILLGGGVLCDMGGFAAASYKRGIDFVHIPTTLLAQVDATIGGKTGINVGHLKNMAGSFAPPKSLFIDPAFLTTLPQRQLVNGYAEMIKHALIDSPEHWEAIQAIESVDATQLSALIERSQEVKQQIVEADPFEKGIRKTLNFGHTIGHAIEAHSLENDSNPLLHGEAIAIGMVTETWLSVQRCGFPTSQLEKITQYIRSIYGKYVFPARTQEAIITHMQQDKKNQGNTIKPCLLENIAQPILNLTIRPQLIHQALDYYQHC